MTLEPPLLAELLLDDVSGGPVFGTAVRPVLDDPLDDEPLLEEPDDDEPELVRGDEFDDGDTLPPRW